MLRKTFADQVYHEDWLTDYQKSVWRNVKQSHISQYYQQAVLRKNEMTVKYTKMMIDLEKFNQTRSRH